MASTSWGSQLDLATDTWPVEDTFNLDIGEDDYGASHLLISEDEDEDGIFITPSQGVQTTVRTPWVEGGHARFSLPQHGHAGDAQASICPPVRFMASLHRKQYSIPIQISMKERSCPWLQVHQSNCLNKHVG